MRSFDDNVVFMQKSCLFRSFSEGWSRDLTKIKITLKRLISRPRFLYEKCSVFHSLSIGTNFGMIWRLHFFTYSGARGNAGGVPRGQTGHVQKRHQVSFCSGAHPDHISKIKKGGATVGWLGCYCLSTHTRISKSALKIFLELCRMLGIHNGKKVSLLDFWENICLSRFWA